MSAGSHHNPRVGGSSPSSAIQVDRKFSGGSRSVYAVMSDGLRAAMPRSLARSRLVSARVESLICYLWRTASPVGARGRCMRS